MAAETTQPTPTLLQRVWARLGAAWEAAAAKLFLWQKTGNTSAVASMAASMAAAATVILLIFLASWWFGPHGFFEN